MGTLVTTLVSVVLAIAISGAIFFGLNALIDATTSRWPVSVAGFLGLLGLLIGAIVQHNGWIKLGGDAPGPLKPGWLTIILGGFVAAAIGFGIGTIRTPEYKTRQRWENRWRPVAFVGPAIAFVLLGLVLPSLKTIIVSFRAGRRGEGGPSLENYRQIFGDDDFFTLEGFGSIFTSRLFIAGLFAVIIAMFAAYASAAQLNNDAESKVTNKILKLIGLVLGLGVLLAFVGLAEGIARDPNRSWIFDNILTPVSQSRVTLFVGVALFFVGGAYYLFRTFSGKAETNNFAVELRQARTTRPALLGALLAAGIGVMALRLFGTITNGDFLSLVLLVAGLALLTTVLSANGAADNLDLGSPTASMSLVFAVIMVALSVFSTLQSVLWNNLWWVATVTGLSTVLGLALAMLADRAKGEKAARTFIFLPMAISMVGAAVIWDFVFELRAFGAQTGLANAILQGIGFKPRGFFINSTMIPWNNFWIMLIMVWIQTGFAMVILSAAIKAVPTELVEAAQVDGASETQVFWRVIIPQIRTTVVVVVTTLIIVIMKVFDLVKATTGGANRTSVLANEMFNQLRDANFALSSAFAVVIFALVLPVMIFNVRRNLKEIS